MARRAGRTAPRRNGCHPGASGPCPGRLPPVPASDSPRRSAEALATATDRPTGGHWFQWPSTEGRGADRRLDPGPGQVGRIRPSGQRPRSARPTLARTGHPAPTDPFRPRIGSISPEKSARTLVPKIVACGFPKGALKCVIYAIYRNSAADKATESRLQALKFYRAAPDESQHEPLASQPS